MKVKNVIVGAGITGITLAERLASFGEEVLLIEKRNHVGGNCYDYRDKNGIFIQKYGPHIFHTNIKKVFDYFTQFTRLNNYRHKVVAFYKGKYYPIPINLTTVNKFYNVNLKNEKELKDFLKKKVIKIKKIRNSRDVIISKFGIELYNAFIKYYTKKQWDRYPEELDKSVLSRLPIRYNKNDFFFDDIWQGMPIEGFSEAFKKMLTNKNIKVQLNTDFFNVQNTLKYDRLIFTGRIDQFFNFKYGRLDYRCVHFSFEEHDKESYQPNSVVNYTDSNVKFLRVTEFKKFYNLKCDKTVICKEMFGWKGEESYPVIDEKNLKILEKYKKEASKLKNIFFAGRLGTYSYLNMDAAINNALNLFKLIKNNYSD